MPFVLQEESTHTLIRLQSEDGTNRLSRERVKALTAAIRSLSHPSAKPLIVTGNDKFFSAGADLNEISALTGAGAFEFGKMGQELMLAVDRFPAHTFAAISGYCMGGGLDLALACDFRIATPHSVFGHRGAALGIMTGWGGTQRLPRLIGKARALQMFLAAEKLHAREALACGLIDEISDTPLQASIAKSRALCASKI